MLQLTDIINVDVLKDLVENLWKSSGLPTRLVDGRGRVLASAGYRPGLCGVFLPRDRQRPGPCFETVPGQEVPPEVDRSWCPFASVGVPVAVAGRHLADLFICQFFYAPPGERLLHELPARSGLAAERCRAILQDVPVVGRERVQEILLFYEMMARLLDEMGRNRLAALESRAQLEESEKKFRSIVDCNPLGVLLYELQEDGRLLFAGGNPAADSLLGRQLDRWIGRPIEEIFPPLALTDIPDRYRAVCGGARFGPEEIAYTGDGVSGIYEVHAFSTENNRMAVLFSDITERKEREEETLYRQRFEALLAGISTRCMELGNARLDEAMDLALADLGSFAQIDRAYLFVFADNGERMSNTHEWCAPGIEPQKHRLQDLAVDELPWIVEKLRSRGLVHVPRVADLPAEAATEREHLAAQGIRSLLSIPFAIGGRVAGFLGFDAVRAEKTWNEHDILLLRLVGEVIASAMERRRIADALEFRVRLEALIATISSRMVNLQPEEVDTAIEAALRGIGQFVGSDRSYVFLFSEDGGSMRNTHEWTAPGIFSCKADLAQVPLSAFPWFIPRIRRRNYVYVPEVAALGAEARQEKAEWLREDIRSLLCLPIAVGDRLLGFIGFDSVRQAKEWPPEVVALMQVVGECFANALERRQADRTLQERNAHLQAALYEAQEAREKIAAILRSLRAGLLATDRQGRIVLMNREAEAILEQTVDCLLGQPAAAVIPVPELRDQIVATLRGAAGLAPAEWEIRQSSGARVIQAQTDRMVAGDGVAGAITLLYDVTREREIDRMKNEFISTAAHELRTPMTSVMGYAELLLGGDFGTFSAERQEEFLREIYSSAEHLAGIVDDLLNLSRVESGQLVRLRCRPERLETLLQEIIGEFRHLHPQYTFELASEALPELIVDRGKIRQVMENLLGNAVKFSPAGSAIAITARAIADKVEIRVADAGIGMTEEQARHVFDKFYRGDMSNTAVGGLGLGMTIVKNIVTAHGGDIAVESAPGEGTQVTFTLPPGMPERCETQTRH